MILALITTVLTQMYFRSMTFLPVTDLHIQRTKAQVLALGGVQLAISKLTGMVNAPTKSKPNVDFLTRVLPALNRWEKVVLTEQQDGIDGEIRICLSCEDGKINLNQIKDLDAKLKEKRTQAGQKSGLENAKDRLFESAKSQANDSQAPNVTPQDKYLERILIKIMNRLTQLTKGELESDKAASAIRNFLEQRDLIDVTELLTLGELAYFRRHVFYEPLLDDHSDQMRPVYLTDLFTTWSDSPYLQPWLLSDSVTALFGFPRAMGNDIMKRERNIQEWVRLFKENAQWATDWNASLGLVYGVDVQSLPKEALEMFDPKFQAQTFSVMVWATVSGVTQKLYAILKRSAQADKAASWGIAKLYWL